MLKVILCRGSRTVCGDVRVQLKPPSLLEELGGVREPMHGLLKSLWRDRIMDNLIAYQMKTSIEKLVELKRAHKENLDMLEAGLQISADEKDGERRTSVHFRISATWNASIGSSASC